MIYITGDTHNTTDMANLSAETMRCHCTEQGCDYGDIKYAIVLGDFGLPWHDCRVDYDGIHPTEKDDSYLMRWYNEKPFCVLAVMGNHDNYNMIEKLPEVDMFGEKVLRVSENIFYLRRGHIYNIDGKTFLVLGGAQSQDKTWRKLDVDLWAQEEWTREEEESCLRRIESHGTQVDYILSHTCSISGISYVESSCNAPEYAEAFREDGNVRFCDRIDSLVDYRKWFFGHWHVDLGYENFLTSRYVPLYNSGIVI